MTMNVAKNVPQPFKNVLKISGRMPKPQFFLIGTGAFVFYLAFLGLMLMHQNYWSWYSFLPYTLATSLCLYILFAACRRRFQDAGYSVWFPTTAIVAALASKSFSLFGWVVSDSGELEMGLAIWEFLIEFPAVLGCILISLYVLSRPSQPGPNKYGPNPFEVAQ